MKMIKVPGPGDFRGEGEWEDFIKFTDSLDMSVNEREKYWIHLQETGFLPTKEE